MARQKRLLIIDDAVFQSEVLAEVFKNQFGEALSIEISKEYDDSVIHFNQQDFDLVLIDYLLGTSLRANDLKHKLLSETNSKAKWIVLSALDVEELKQKHQNDGFHDFVHKSDYSVVSKVVEEVLEL